MPDNKLTGYKLLASVIFQPGGFANKSTASLSTLG